MTPNLVERHSYTGLVGEQLGLWWQAVRVRVGVRIRVGLGVRVGVRLGVKQPKVDDQLG